MQPTTQTEVFALLGHRWNVSKAKELAERGEGGTPARLDVHGIFSMLSLIRIDREYVASMPAERLDEKPVLCVRLDDDSVEGVVLPIDGWHRIAKACELGRDVLPGFVFDTDEHLRLCGTLPHRRPRTDNRR